MIKKSVVWLVLFLLIASFSLAEECAFLFYGENCPGCDDADAYIKNIEQNKPEFTVQRYEVYYNKEHADLAKQYFIFFIAYVFPGLSGYLFGIGGGFNASLSNYFIF